MGRSSACSWDRRGQRTVTASIGAAARAAGAHGVIERLPGGYATLLGKGFVEGAELSAGEWQRLALARAWSLAPDVLLLDEPTASLDPHAKREVEALIAEFAAGGMTLVLASHNLGQVKRLATRVAYLEQGRLLADLPVQDFFNGPLLARVSPEAALFLKGELG